jgi:hypothetical protein
MTSPPAPLHDGEGCGPKHERVVSTDVIGNHVAEEVGRSGEESHVSKMPDYYAFKQEEGIF